MLVRVLGPLEVVDAGQPVPLGGPKERRLLAALAVHAGEVVSEARLIDILWGDDPPRTATKTLQNYVLRLRKALQRAEDASRSSSGDVRILTRAPGYLLEVGPEGVDSTIVSNRVAAARSALSGGDYETAARLLDEVLASWRGPSLVEFADEAFAMAEAARLDELRQVAVEDRVDAELALGRHQDCVGELEALLADDPLRERRWGQLMLALYRSGRQADALRAYQRARSTLVEELGIEPGPDLRRLEQAIIEQDPSLELAAPPPLRVVGEPVPAAPAIPPGMVAPPGVPFVGREKDLAALLRAWERAQEGQRRVVVVGGEPGIGKTTLARVLARHVSESGGVVLAGRCDEELQVPYEPFGEALRWYVSEASQREVAGQLGPLGGELVRLVPDLPFRVPGLSDPVAADPAVERYRLFEAVVAFLTGISTARPVLLVLDDLQWAAKSTLLLVRHVVRNSPQARLLLLATCRDAVPDTGVQLAQLLDELVREPGVARLHLAGLDDAESLALVSARAGQELDEAGVAFVRSLRAETDGNPFFIDEILRHLVETGTVYRRDGRWRSDYEIGDIELPEGVRGVVRERLSRLSEATNRALAVGALAGDSFSLDLLERVPEAGARADDLLDGLDEAVRARILLELADRPGTYAFAHGIIREVLRRELTAARRARLHARVGEAYEAMPDADAHLDALAHHFAEAGQMERAADYALRAGLQAVSKLAFEVAVAQLERGIRSVDQAPVPDRARRADLLLALADARRLVGDVAGAKEAALRTVDDARALGSPTHLAAAAILQTGLGVAGRPDPSVGKLCEEALDALDTLGPESAGLRVQVLARLALHRAIWEGRAPAGSVLGEEALQLARQLGDPEALQTALFARALTLVGSPEVADRLGLGEELVELGRARGDRRVLVRGLRVRALARLELGDVGGFDEDRERLQREAGEHRDWMGLAETARWRALRALLHGQFDEAEACVREMIAHAGAEGNTENARASQLFFLYRDVGRLEEARREVEVALTRSPGLVGFRVILALALVESGQREDARRLLDELAVDNFANLPRDFTWPAALYALATTCYLLGDAERAEVLLDLCRPHAGHLVLIGWGDAVAGAADRMLGMLEATLKNWHAAEAHYAAALELEAALGAAPLLVRTRACYAHALRQRGEPGDEQRAEELLALARADADALGMEGWAADAQPPLRRLSV